MDAVRTTLSSIGQNRLAASEGIAKQDGPAEAMQRGGASFGQHLLDTVSEADQLITRAEEQASALASGKADAVDTIIAVSKADLALRHVVTLRNRAIEAYQEIMRMPL